MGKLWKIVFALLTIVSLVAAQSSSKYYARYYYVIQLYIFHTGISKIDVEEGSIPVYEMYDRKYNDMTFGGHVKLKLKVFKHLQKKVS